MIPNGSLFFFPWLYFLSNHGLAGALPVCTRQKHFFILQLCLCLGVGGDENACSYAFPFFSTLIAHGLGLVQL
jgi:hypothetical protein